MQLKPEDAIQLELGGFLICSFTWTKDKNYTLFHFSDISVPFHTKLLNELVKRKKMQQHKSRENIHFTHWPDVLEHVSQTALASKVSPVPPSVGSDRSRITFSPQKNRPRGHLTCPYSLFAPVQICWWVWQTLCPLLGLMSQRQNVKPTKIYQ